MHTILIDGNWNLKRNYYRTTINDIHGEKCNGVYGFLLSLNSVIEKVMPDRVVVFWDGIAAGKFRYNIYKPYKANRKKDWNADEKAILQEKNSDDPDIRERYEVLVQKIRTKNIIEDLFVRQLEVDYIEADDLIAQYCILSRQKNDGEKITIFSRDKDYRMLISDNVSLMTPDNLSVITKDNFKSKLGYTLDNELFFKCFEGDDSDCIKGVKGITRNTLIKRFPSIKDRRYTYRELVNECIELQKDKKLKLYDKIIDAENILYRNAKLMNLHKPFITDQAIEDVREILESPLDFESRSINNAMNEMNSQGISRVMQEDSKSTQSFLSPFYRLMHQERKFNNFK